MASPSMPILASTGSGLARGPASIASRIYDDLRHRIINLELKPDTTLSRGELAATYGASQTPLREALQRLEQEGLVRTLPQSRTLVTRIDRSELAEAQFLRLALETEVARRLAENPEESLLQRIRGIVKLQEALADDLSQAELFNDLDRTFHRALFQALGLESTHALMMTRLGHLARCQRLLLPRRGKMKEILKAHLAIVDGIAAGDPARAELAVREHLSKTTSRIEQLMKDYPDYFAGS